MAVKISERSFGGTEVKNRPELQLVFLFIIVNNASKVVVLW
jgi:hypothetical protein